MKILSTGAKGYIGKRLLIQILAEGHTVVCSVRDQHRFSNKFYNDAKGNVEIIENDFLKPETFTSIPKDIDLAYYLIHSMSSDDGDFSEKEKLSALNFRNAVSTASSSTEC